MGTESPALDALGIQQGSRFRRHAHHHDASQQPAAIPKINAHTVAQVHQVRQQIHHDGFDRLPIAGLSRSPREDT
ncbi:hypothetical protein CQJ27_26155 [Escherichia sp. E1130]|nr:hypothetical protein CQJ27_26155 [Escherichia sp. E1130]